MSEVENLVLEHLKRIQTDISALREDNSQIKMRLSSIESGIARIARSETENYAEIIQDRHSVDRLQERILRIERRLELTDH
ncbi:hypothetical protein [Propionivibrio sp.]|uniref:hypothetical protein n=1 Tax=Propionivibrio sp. TaxID=2212460 RepID=UPI003BF2CF1E